MGRWKLRRGQQRPTRGRRGSPCSSPLNMGATEGGCETEGAWVCFRRTVLGARIEGETREKWKGSNQKPSLIINIMGVGVCGEEGKHCGFLNLLLGCFNSNAAVSLQFQRSASSFLEYRSWRARSWLLSPSCCVCAKLASRTCTG